MVSDHPVTFCSLCTQVEVYVSKFGDLPAVTATDLVDLDAQLLTKTFLAGNTLTLADLVTYAAVAPSLVSLWQRASLWLVCL